MPAQEKLSPTEQILAYLIGGGIALAILAGFLLGLDVINTDYALSFFLVALVLIVIGTGAWLYLLRPWDSFDDLTTPHYTGHAHHDDHAEAVADAAAEEAVVEAVVETEPEPEPVAKVAKAVAETVVKPEPVAEAAAEPDDLTIIEGVGPKSAEALVASGVSTYKTMAGMTPDALEDAVKSQKVRLVGSTSTWPMQAELAAHGEYEALDALKGRIKGGFLHDDLTKIEGVGPKAQEALYEGGFRSYAEVAAADAAALNSVLEAANLKLLKADTWPQQADLLAKGDLDALKTLQDQLTGGRA